MYVYIYRFHQLQHDVQCDSSVTTFKYVEGRPDHVAPEVV